MQVKGIGEKQLKNYSNFSAINLKLINYATHTKIFITSQIELEVSLTAEEMEQFWQAARKKF